MPIAITNTMNIIGETQDPEKFMPLVIKKVLNEETMSIHASPEGEIGSRFYLHARNQAHALLFALTQKFPVYGEADVPERFNIVGERELNNLQMAEIIASAVGKPLKYKLEDFHSSRPGHDLRYALDGNKLAYDTGTNTGTAFGKDNIVSQEVYVKGDLRAVSATQLEKAQKIMTDIVASNYPETSASIDFGDGGYPPMTLTEGNKKLLGYFNQVSVDLGFGTQTATNPRKAGAADISFASTHVEMALDGIGLPGADGHTIKETANIDYLPIEAKRSAVLIYRLLNGDFKQ